MIFAPLILFAATAMYRLLVLLLAIWVARPSSRLDLDRLERALTILSPKTFRLAIGGGKTKIET